MTKFQTALKEAGEKRDKELSRGHDMCNQIINLKPGMAFCVEEDYFLPFWKYQFNPEKGETADSEMYKWLGSLAAINIEWGRDLMEYKFYFRKKDNEQKMS